MEPTIALSEATRSTAGVLLLTVPLVQLGGYYMLRVVRGQVPLTPFQQTFARAGHAHAGVFVILGLVAQLFVDGTRLEGFIATVARSGIPLAAILIPAGFFLSSAGRGRTRPNGLIALIDAGFAALAAGAITLAIGLLTA